MSLSIKMAGQKHKVGSEISVPVVVEGAKQNANLSFTAVGLPDGLSINQRTGVIFGTATRPGPFEQISLTVTDSEPPEETAACDFNWFVFKSSVHVDEIGDQTHYVGEQIKLTINTSGGNLSFQEPVLPDGLTFTAIDDSTVFILGEATRAVTRHPVSIGVTDQSTNETLAPISFYWTILDQELVMDAVADQQHFEGEDIYLQIRSHSSNVSYSADGLPPGMTIDPDSGVISGTAVKAGKYTDVTVSVTDKTDPGRTVTKKFDWIVQETLDVTDKWFKLEVPDYDNSSDVKRSYFRLGSPDTTYEETFLCQKDAYSKPGWLEYTDGDKVVETQGDHYQITKGELYNWNDEDSFEFNLAPQYELGFGLKFESFTGLAAEIFLGGKYEANAAILPVVGMKTGFEIEYGFSGKYEATDGPEFSLSGDIVKEATKKIQLSVDPIDTAKWEMWAENIAPKVAAAGAAVMGVAGTFATISGGAGWSLGGKGGAIATQGLAGVLYVAGVLNALVDMKKRKWMKNVDEPRSIIEMDKDKAEIRCGDSSLVLNHNGSIELKGKEVVVKGNTSTKIVSSNKVAINADNILVTGLSKYKARSPSMAIGDATSTVTISGTVQEG